tara:strand:- start:35 stop:265 length:231 start_codon:yes stop_codon:yes gene_type:complete
MVNSKYPFPISDKMLMIVKTKNKKKIYCSKGHDEKLTLLHGQRICKKCNKISRKKSSQRYLLKKEKEKSESFKVHF